MSISFLYCWAISVSSVVAQSIYPDSVGCVMRYNALIELKQGYVSGVCLIVNEGEVLKASLFNEFGISALDFSYNPRRNKVKLLNVMSFLDKWYIKRVLKKDIVALLHNFKSGIGEYRDERYGIDYKFNILDYGISE